MLDKRDRFAQRLGHLEAHHDDGQAAAAKGSHGDFFTLGELFGGNQAHAIQLAGEFGGRLVLERVVGVEQRQLVGDLANAAAQLVVLAIVLAVLHVVPAQDLDLTDIVFMLVVQKVDLFQELLLVMLELPHAGGVRRAVASTRCARVRRFALCR